MSDLSVGEYPEEVVIKEEMNQKRFEDSLNELRARISSAAEFSKEIGSGNLEIEYEEKFSNDVLAKAIIDIREKLVVNVEEERQRALHNEGIAKFITILQ